MTSTSAQRHARPFVAGFLAVLVVCALGPLNLWPFSNWELFSRLRTDKESAWEAVAVYRSGGKHDYAIASVPRDDRGAMCNAWLHSGTKFGPGTRSVRVYHVQWLLSDRRGNRPAPRHDTFAWSCSAKGHT